MTKKIKQKKSKTKAVKAAKLKLSKSKGSAAKAAKNSAKNAGALKSQVKTSASAQVRSAPAIQPDTAIKTAPATQKTSAQAIKSTPAQPSAAEAKPALSGREAARLALVQKAASSKWASLYSKASKIPVSPYNLKSQYEIETAISHKTLGWGYIQDKKNDRLEVLFENGIKYLISNYK